MVRDPVCGTFVLPERAVILSDGRTRVFFCSDVCRDTYRSRRSSGPGRSKAAEGRRA
jgi:YHS domain-containing protein